MGRSPRERATAKCVGPVLPHTTARLPFSASRTQEQGWSVDGEKGHPVTAAERGKDDRLPFDCARMYPPSRRP